MRICWRTSTQVPRVAGGVLPQCVCAVWEVLPSPVVVVMIRLIWCINTCVNGLYTSQSHSWKGREGKEWKEWNKVYSFFSFAYSVWCVDPESSLERRAPLAGYFPGSPGSETGLWSPDGPELSGTSGRDACRLEGNLCASWCLRCSTESAPLCVSLCSVSTSLSKSPAKLPSERVSVHRGGGGESLGLYGAFSRTGL